MVQWLGVHHTMQEMTWVQSLVGELESRMSVSGWAPVPQLLRPYATTGEFGHHNEDARAAAETQHSQLNKYILKILMARHQICKKIIRIIITNFCKLMKTFRGHGNIL